MSSSETKSYGDDAASNNDSQSSEESKTNSGRQTGMSKSALADGKEKKERMTGVRFADQVEVADMDIGEIGSKQKKDKQQKDDDDVNYTSSERDTSGMNTYMRGGGSNTTSIIEDKGERRGDQKVYLETEGDLFH